MTTGGKVFCIIFAIIGIPITLILLGAIIERLMVYTTRLLQNLIDTTQPYINALFTHSYNVSEIRIFFAFVCATLVLSFLMLIPAAIYSNIEGWSYLNAFYYCFISLTTIGLGGYKADATSDCCPINSTFCFRRRLCAGRQDRARIPELVQNLLDCLFDPGHFGYGLAVADIQRDTRVQLVQVFHFGRRWPTDASFDERQPVGEQTRRNRLTQI